MKESAMAAEKQIKKADGIVAGVDALGRPKKFLIVESGKGNPVCLPARLEERRTEVTSIGEDKITCSYAVYRATSDSGQEYEDRELTYVQLVQYRVPTAHRDAHAAWLATAQKRLAAEKNQEEVALLEHLASDRPLEFLRTLESRSFNKLGGGLDTTRSIVQAFLAFVGLDEKNAKHIRAHSGYVHDLVIARLRGLVPQIREERKQAWLARQASNATSSIHP